MRCRHCGTDPIFWMSCNCGCSVIFDALGPPWPKHKCLEAHFVGVVDGVAPEVADLCETPWTDDMAAVKPQEPGDRCEEVGVVGNLVLERNIERKFGVEDTPSGRTALGPLATFRPGTITIHTARYPTPEQRPVRESVTGWTSRTKLRKFQIGDAVKFRFVAEEVQGELIWIAKSLKSVFN